MRKTSLSFFVHWVESLERSICDEFTMMMMMMAFLDGIDACLFFCLAANFSFLQGQQNIVSETV